MSPCGLIPVADTNDTPGTSRVVNVPDVAALQPLTSACGTAVASNATAASRMPNLFSLRMPVLLMVSLMYPPTMAKRCCASLGEVPGFFRRSSPAPTSALTRMACFRGARGVEPANRDQDRSQSDLVAICHRRWFPHALPSEVGSILTSEVLDSYVGSVDVKPCV